MKILKKNDYDVLLFKIGVDSYAYINKNQPYLHVNLNLLYKANCFHLLIFLMYLSVNTVS